MSALDTGHSFDTVSGLNVSLLNTVHSFDVKPDHEKSASFSQHLLHHVCTSCIVIDTVRLHWTVFYHSRESVSGLTQTNIQFLNVPVAQFVRM